MSTLKYMFCTEDQWLIIKLHLGILFIFVFVFVFFFHEEVHEHEAKETFIVQTFTDLFLLRLTYIDDVTWSPIESFQKGMRMGKPGELFIVQVS